jgi:hypothetical protein
LAVFAELKKIEERLCLTVNYENAGLIRPNKIKAIKRTTKMSFEKMSLICKNCKHS